MYNITEKGIIKNKGLITTRLNASGINTGNIKELEINNIGEIAGIFIDANGGKSSISNNGNITKYIWVSGANPNLKINNNGTMSSDYSALIKVPTNRINPITIGNDGSLISDSVIINPNGGPNESITLNNKGVLVHNGLLSSNYETVNQNSLGIEIVHAGNGIVSSIRNDGGNENIINGKIVGKDSFIIAEDNSVFNNKIINGAGVEKGTLQTNGALNINDSIVNSYKRALYLGENSNAVITNSIFNGGGLDGSTSVIIGDDNNNLQLLGDSIVNGNINFGGGDDLLALDTTAIINGDINGGVGKDTLAFLGKNNLSVNIYNNISEFENININGDVVLFESINVTDADSINLESGNLTLRVDPTKKDSNGKIIGHALYGNTGMINSTGGKLVVGLNGLGENSIISMGSTIIAKDVNDNWWKDTDNLKTNSLVLDGKLSEDGKDINVTIKEFVDLVPSIPANPPVIIDKVLYNNLNNIYDSIVSAGEIGKLSNTTLLESKTKEESLEALLSVLDQIYANTPYSYTLKSSRDSLKLFGDNISYLTIKPKYQEWLVQGRGIHTGVKSDNEASGKRYYGFDGGHRNYKTTINT
ncbi:MAG: hypothetical protein ACRC4T_23145 [Cetobacterium sp.]